MNFHRVNLSLWIVKERFCRELVSAVEVFGGHLVQKLAKLVQNLLGGRLIAFGFLRLHCMPGGLQYRFVGEDRGPGANGQGDRIGGAA